jgi:antitoxin component HigA of HigAB toxin-antitoxin module
MPVVIETEEENERMLKVIEKLMDKGEGLSPEEEKLLKLLTRLVEDFEEQYYHPRDASPLEVLQPNGVSRSKADPPVGSLRLEGHCFRGTQRQTRNQQDS